MTEASPIRLLVVDDHSAVRNSIVRLFSQHEDLNVVGEAPDGFKALEMIHENEYDLILLDVSMPGKSGLDVLREIKQAHPSIPVVMLSIHSPEKYRDHALSLGANDYICKDLAGEELVRVVRRILAGS